MIGCAGRKTTIYDCNYPSMKGKLAAIVYGLRKFEHIHWFKRFKLGTDNIALTYLQSIKLPCGVMARWLNEVQ